MEISNMGIAQKVDFLLRIAKSRICSESEFECLLQLLSEHSVEERIGKVFGYSVSDYAIVTLSRLTDENSVKFYNQIFENLTNDRKKVVNELSSKKLYLQY